MSNTYGISMQDEREIRARDKTCVYCQIVMKQRPHAMAASGATIEHFNNDGPFEKKYNVAICCRRCNSSKGTMSLSAWFKTPYCREKKINEETVSEPVKEYLRLKSCLNSCLI
jgi:5-methylcytosine-specific restriction endonuclease McrA